MPQLLLALPACIVAIPRLAQHSSKCARCPHHSDVVATSRQAHYTKDHGYTTFGAIEAFHATRLDSLGKPPEGNFRSWGASPVAGWSEQSARLAANPRGSARQGPAGAQEAGEKNGGSSHRSDVPFIPARRAGSSACATAASMRTAGAGAWHPRHPPRHVAGTRASSRAPAVSSASGVPI